MRIKELREEKGLSQSEVALAIGGTQSNLAKWEKGTVQPSADFLKKLADYFNVSSDYLLERTDELGGILPERSPALQLTEDEKNLLENFRRMDHSQKIRLEAYIEGLLGNDAAAKRKL